jgi:predicted lipoprotein with Yx(FWY)xxD motif
VKRRFLNSRLVAVGAVLAVLALTATAIASSGSASRVKTRRTGIGTILVDARGKTLYLFEKDKNARSSCYGACAANWPPYLTTARPKAGAGARASLLATTKRKNGTLQVTYRRHPLYRFKFDTKAGSTKGQDVHAFGGDWYAVTAKGTSVEPAAPSSGGDVGGSGSGNGPTGPTGPAGYGGGGYSP